MKTRIIYKSLDEIKPGDIVVDRTGNKLMILQADNSYGDWFAFFNGKIKRINERRVTRIKGFINE
jgi:uncharacterized protein YfaT (DUF1175 family)